ncbi:hypothetical protein [Motilibacter deserti]|uniref:Fibronectin type-III domain-containing protein n=1 Tax=Motilibacter deserti TaxID=2714956 RepID=A0ABX0GUI0_9ACTN|nr:hypothetical protein [Motilibacter deserti]NHC13322.1 hypothetical protein [Motilibacter deserti]
MSSALRRSSAVALATGGLLLSPLTGSSALADPDYGVAPSAPYAYDQVVSSAGFTVQFTDNSDNEYVFYLELSNNNGGTWTRVDGAWRSAVEGTGGQSALSASTGKLGTLFRVVAYNGAGASASNIRMCC